MNENRGTQFAHLAQVNVDELSDDGLANVIDELKSAVRRFALETIMFEGMTNVYQVILISHIRLSSINILSIRK